MLQEMKKGWPLPWIFAGEGEKSGRGAGSIIASVLDAEGLVTPVATALILPAAVKTRSRHGIPMITMMWQKLYISK